VDAADQASNMTGRKPTGRTSTTELQNDVTGAITAEIQTGMDFFMVPTVTFKLLYCFFIISIISHDRRQIVRCNVTRQPSPAVGLSNS